MAAHDVRPQLTQAVSITENEDKVSIQCGKAKITLHQDGRIGSVNLN